MARRCALLVGLLACAAEAIHLRRQQVTQESLQREAEGLDRYVNHAAAHLLDVCKVQNHTLVNHTNASHANTSMLCHNRTEVLTKEQNALQDLLGHLKTNIKRFNSDEASGKSEGAKMVTQVQARLDHDKAQLKNASLSKWERELLENRTRAEEHELAYWKRGRTLEHSMFHANLKMTHGLMSRVRTVIEAYKEVLAKGKISPKLAEDIKKVGASVPKAFIELSATEEQEA